ncbi:MAG: hypothetical protein ACYTBJ_00625 [Planctomycetota bacterium]
MNEENLLESNLYAIKVDGCFVTERTHKISGITYPIVEQENMKYAKFFQTYKGCKGAFNKISKIWPSRLVEIVSVEIKVSAFLDDNHSK